MQQNGISRYCHLVSRELVCSKTRKNDLISGLGRALAENPSFTTLSAEQLQADYATVSDAARELQDLVPDQERKQILRRGKRRKRILIAALVAVIVLLAVLFIWYILHDVSYVVSSIRTEY